VGRALRVDSRHSVATTAAVAAAIVVALSVCWFGFADHDLSATRQHATTPNSTGADGWQLLSSMYSPPRDRVQAAFDLGDGQLYAGMATDPLVRHAAMVRGGRSEEAYRYQRPAYAWLGWMLSAGRRGAVQWALLALTMASVVALVTVLARALESRGQDPFAALAVLVAPGVLANLMWIGPEALGTTLVLIGVLRILRDDGGRGLIERVDPLAVMCFAGAALCRESMLLVPATLALVALCHRRWASTAKLALAAVPYLTWVLVLRWRVGSWPVGSVPGRLSPVPLAGLVRSLSSPSPVAACLAVATIAVGVIGAVVSREPLLRWLIVAHLTFGVFMGTAVWSNFDGFGRVLLPMLTFGILAAVPALAERPALRLRASSAV
jgi:hypothetical protein